MTDVQRRHDAGREALYAAELAAFDGTSYEAIASFEELVALAEQVTSAAWWPRGPVAVVTARSDARSSSTQQRGVEAPVIRLAAGQFTPATVLHELAHVLAGLPAGHGPRFRCAYLDLVMFAWGQEPAAWLSQEFDNMRLAVGTRHWPLPVRSSTSGNGGRSRPSGPIAL